MIKVLLILLPVALILGGLGYFRYSTSKQTALERPGSSQQADQQPIEVPKTLPQATTEERIKALEDVITKLVTQVNALKSQSPQPLTATDSKISSLESSVTELKARLAVLEKASPLPGSTGKYPLYIPLGSSSNSWNNVDWTTLNEFENSINPDNYTGYTTMQLEATLRLDDSSGTGSVRLYNVTDNTVVNSQIDTSSTTFSLKSSSQFSLPSGTKTYRIQIKSTGSKNLFIQNARIKVNF